MKFYGVNIDQPLSRYLGTSGSDWANSPLGRLAEGSYLMDLRDHPRWDQIQAAPLAWRVVDVAYSTENTTMTRFRAYGPDGEHLPHATFGVNFGGCSQIAGGFYYQPWHGNKYTIPLDNQIMVPETGGYAVTVLDLENPSEGFAFGMLKGGSQQHSCLVISFRLLPFNAAEYPGA